MKQIIILFAAVLLISCSNCNTVEDMAEAKQEIMNAEKEFMALADKSGLAVAFSTFADTGAVVKQDKKLIKGVDSIKVFYENNSPESAKLQWTATFVDVAASCDLGYTYGTYTYSAKDPMGNPIESNGYFHTVWKKQADGKWKFVWD
jgi:ketosteroid isomerase-like protein